MILSIDIIVLKQARIAVSPTANKMGSFENGTQPDNDSHQQSSGPRRILGVADLLPPNPPPPNDPTTPAHVPDTKTYTVKVLDNPNCVASIINGDVYFFPKHNVRLWIYFEQTDKMFPATIANMRVRHWHGLLVPERPADGWSPLILQWWSNGTVVGQPLEPSNRLVDEIPRILQGERVDDVVGGPSTWVLVQDA